jgi:2,3-bisphosphoglycerate-independent phosphoglycerate mutase
MRSILIILDDWSISVEKFGNAQLNAYTPNFDYLVTNYPFIKLKTSSEDVGLSWGVWGNSETGHAAIGSGRICWQYLEKINRDIEKDRLKNNAKFISFLQKLKDSNNALHVITLFSEGNVHSNYKQTIEFLSIAQNYLPKIWLHVISDGRDTPPKSIKKIITTFYNHRTKLDFDKIKIATLIGRFYAMDRDKNWERTQKAYDLIVDKKADIQTDSVRLAVNENYKIGKDDETALPSLVDQNYSFQKNDGLFFANYRADRMRQLVKMFANKNEENKVQQISSPILTLTDYLLPTINLEILYKQDKLENTLAEVLSKNAFTQLHVTETEKYAHLTYFFNGGIEKPFLGEKNIIIPSPKVDTYQKAPRMSADKITDQVLLSIKNLKENTIIINYANADMVGHTGDYNAAVLACQAVDENLGKVLKAGLENQYNIFVTADHGNADQMINPITGIVNKEHTTNPVPFVFANSGNRKNKTSSLNDFYNLPAIGILADIAPSILETIKIKKPKEMTGESIINSMI